MLYAVCVKPSYIRARYTSTAQLIHSMGCNDKPVTEAGSGGQHRDRKRTAKHRIVTRGERGAAGAS